MSMTSPLPNVDMVTKGCQKETNLAIVYFVVHPLVVVDE